MLEISEQHIAAAAQAIADQEAAGEMASLGLWQLPDPQLKTVAARFEGELQNRLRAYREYCDSLNLAIKQIGQVFAEADAVVARQWGGIIRNG